MVLGLFKLVERYVLEAYKSLHEGLCMGSNVMSWLSENGLALYGALTGTLALGVSFFTHRHNVSKDQIKLKISFADHPRKLENIQELRSEDNNKSFDKISLVEIYVVTVCNLGSIPAPLKEVGVVDRNGARHQALVSSSSGGMMRWLVKSTETEIDQLNPRTSRDFNIYLEKEKPVFEISSAYAIDQTGKEWRSSR